MTAEELKNVAGFKAVDAEGNELGVVSLSDIVSAVKQELQPSGVARASVSALSEVSAQAATDTYEDQLPQKTDATWIRGLDASGNPILISKQSLASVLEELLMFKFPSLPNSTNSLDTQEGGCIHVSNTATDSPEKVYGSCMTFPNQTYAPQLFITWNSNIYIRGNTLGSNWKRVLTEDV